MSAALDLRECVEAAKEIAREAGKIILEGHSSRAFRVESKGGVDLVTEVDRKSEAHIITELRKRYGAFDIVAEEDVSDGGGPREIGEGPTWVVDPLDGTSNFVAGLPMVCVCIGLLHERRPVAGVIYNPILKEMYWAYEGGGAWRDGERLRIGAARGLADATIVNNIGASRDAAFARKTLGRLEELMASNVRALRNLGSAAMNMAWVAAGVLDCYFEDGYGGPWDVVAGCCLVREAGGAFHLPEGGALEFRGVGKGKIVCGNAAVCRAVTEALRRADAKRASWPRVRLDAGHAVLGAALAAALAGTLLR